MATIQFTTGASPWAKREITDKCYIEVCDSCHGLSRQLPRIIVAVVTDYRDNCHTTWEALLKQDIFGICAHHLSVLPPVKEDGKVRKKQIAKTQRPHPTAGHSASRRPQEDIRPLPIIHRIYLAKPQRSLRTQPFAGAVTCAGPKDYRGIPKICYTYENNHNNLGNAKGKP